MSSSRRIVSNNRLSQHDSSVMEAAKKRQEEKFMQHLSIPQAEYESQLQLKRRSTRVNLAKRNSGSQILMPEPDYSQDNNEQVISPVDQIQNKSDLQAKQTQNDHLQYFQQVADRFMQQGLDSLNHSSEEGEKSGALKDTEKANYVPETKVETDNLKFLQQNKPLTTSAGDEDEIPEFETMEIQTKQVCRIRMAFKLTVPKSTLPRKMPETIVYWNRCETKISIDSQAVLSQQQLDDFYQNCGVKLHDYPEARKKVAKNFPLLDKKQLWADPLQEQFTNPMESLIYYSPEMKSWISQLNKPRQVEGHITIENLRDTDVFFNSKFESGNLKQAFIVPQPSDFDELTDEEAMIGDYLPKEEQEYLRSMLDKRREKRKEDIQKSLHDSDLKNTQSDPKLPTTSKPEIDTEKLIDQQKIKNKQPLNDNKPETYLKPGTKDEKIFQANTSDPQIIKKSKKKGTISSEYNLYLQDDTHSDGSRTQWFYFSVMNIKGGTNVKLNIVNMTKPDSSFQKGMQPMVYSTKKFTKSGKGWHRAGKNITYQKNGRTQRSQIKIMDIKYLYGQQSNEQQPDSFKELSTLSFEYKFKFDHDIVYFAHGQPYTYSDYANYLCKLEADQNLTDRMRIDHLCNSVGKSPVYCITITSKIETKYVQQSKECEKWQKFEYSSNQNTDQIKPKKQKREEVSDEEDQKQSKGDVLSPTKKQGSSSKSDFDSALPIQKTNFAESQSLISGRLTKIPEVQHDTESHFPNNIEQKSQETNLHFDQMPNLELSSDEEDNNKKKKVVIKDMREKFYKKAIVITSRVHPGETQSSFLVEGLINYLLSDEDEACEIREKFVIKIIPILNPDGVILGNSRSSLIGVDLNRRWIKPSKFLHPTVYYTKSLIKYFNKKLNQPEVKSGGVVLFTDIHGHNKNQDIFMYGCVVERDYAYHEGNMLIRSIPDGVDRIVPVFSSHKCKFAIETDKVETGRIVVFREFSILNSYTLECSFHGSEHLQRTKQIYMALYTQDYLQVLNQRYNIAPQRNNIYFDTSTYFQAAADFIRGVNWSSKRKPILTNWFRLEPKTIIDPAINKQIDPEAEIDDYLKELENKWRPTGNILDDGKSGMTEKYGGLSLPYIFDGPTQVDDTLEKVAKRKKEKAEREQKRRQQESMLKYSKMSGSKETKRENSKAQQVLNADIADVSKPSSIKNSSSKKPQINSGIQEKNIKRKAKGLNQAENQHRSASPKSIDYGTEFESGTEQGRMSLKSFGKRPMNQTVRDVSRQSNINTKQLLTSPSPSKRVITIHRDNSAKASQSETVSKDLYQTAQSFKQHSILREELFEIVDQKDFKQKKVKVNYEQTTSSKVDSPNEKNRSFKKGQKANLLEQRSSKNQYKVKVDIPVIEKQLVVDAQNSASGNDQSKFGLSIKDHTLENFARLSLIQQSSQDVQSPYQIGDNVSASRRHQKRISFGSSIESESETDELKLPPIFPKHQSQSLSNNLLSADPLVVSSKQLQEMSRVKLKAIAANNRDSSPFKSPSQSKGIFAPINAVFSQRSLISNSGLAGQHNINFFLEQSSVLKGRKMTQAYQTNKHIEEVKSLQLNKPRLSQFQSTKSTARAIEIKNGFELSPKRFEESSLKDHRSASKKLKQVSRPHIILKPLSEVDWMTLQQSPIRNKNKMYNDLTENEQRETLRTLQKVVGTLQIKKNKLMIGRNQLLPMIESYTQGKKSPREHGQSQLQLVVQEEHISQDNMNSEYKWPLVKATPYQNALKILKELQKEI